MATRSGAFFTAVKDGVNVVEQDAAKTRASLLGSVRCSVSLERTQVTNEGE